MTAPRNAAVGFRQDKEKLVGRSGYDVVRKGGTGLSWFARPFDGAGTESCGLERAGCDQPFLEGLLLRSMIW